MVEILVDLIIIKMDLIVRGKSFVKFILSLVMEHLSVEICSIRTLFLGKKEAVLGLEIDSITKASLVPLRTTIARVLVFTIELALGSLTIWTYFSRQYCKSES